MVPMRAPTHQPSEPPTNEPNPASSLDTSQATEFIWISIQLPLAGTDIATSMGGNPRLRDMRARPGDGSPAGHNRDERSQSGSSCSAFSRGQDASIAR